MKQKRAAIATLSDLDYLNNIFINVLLYLMFCRFLHLPTWQGYLPPRRWAEVD